MLHRRAVLPGSGSFLSLSAEIYNTSVIRVLAHDRIVMAKGTVDFFNDTGGYGFIETDDADDDVFFHMEDVGGPDLEEGTDIEFDIEQAPKGPRATNVTRL
ncbi:Cold shock protein, CspA family [Halostagnicola kamekurae]|uniref:Cold shock protein, CspA family n=2 Tax=Halostagnicola kamekurae TaxID=619731 RepID=A0A1I6NWZ1_9EURY|nr:Cold shock protein, CspA family [Halostagnicola kamekurae]